MVKWSFLSYRAEPGEGAVEDVRTWFEGLPVGVQASIAGQLSVSAIQPLKYWQERGFHKQLQDELSALEELRFELQQKGHPKESYRILGLSSIEIREFTMLVGFQKTRGQKDYDEFGGIALDRARQVKANKKYVTTARWLNDYE